MSTLESIINVRKARMSDAAEIFGIINSHAAKEVMLERSLENIYDNLRDFFVVDVSGLQPGTQESAGQGIAGVCSLHIWGKTLAEIRSIAVVPEAAGMGVGTELVRACIKEAAAIGLKKLFALTYTVGFFEHSGFHVEEKAQLPQKIWGDCTRCVKFPDCDETAVVIELG